MPVKYQKFIFRSDLKANPGTFYLFGDNEARAGRGGQAAHMRDEPNAIGIRTKARPSMSPGSFWMETLDDDGTRYRKMIDEDLSKVRHLLGLGFTVVIPADGIGVGRARLSDTAPRTSRYLQEQLAGLAQG